MAKQSRPQKDTIERVMHEFKQGDLDSGSGDKVRNPKQAIAIALSEAGASNQQSPGENKRRLARTKRQEASGKTTRAALYREASQKGISGRSRMTKAQLQQALGRG